MTTEEAWVHSLRDRLGEAAADLRGAADAVQVRDGFPLIETNAAEGPAVALVSAVRKESHRRNAATRSTRP